ncbi:MAG: beta-ketoacyl synthase N-terminal-like domain-containing protein [bacterium]|nr:beta-ketoacyl synthase N-terminal-like domain-containing protein [bacterium]
MSKLNAVITSCDMLTAYGLGTELCWNGLLSKKTAISKLNRFDTFPFKTDYAAIVPGLEYLKNDSLSAQMFKLLFQGKKGLIPEDSKLILATIKGEIDLLEKNILEKKDEYPKSGFNSMLEKLSVTARIKDGGMIISSACTSSSAAIAIAGAMIQNSECDSILVAACDCVSEFVFAGFSLLNALDKFPAKPFDRNRNGLTLGEGAGFILIMSESRAKKEKRKILGVIKGFGLSNDASHMLRPSLDGNGLIIAVRKALRMAEINEENINLISAHGTGTIYNDKMEMNAFSKIFENKKPVYSVKGGIGHTMGAAGLIETMIALKSLKESIIPPTVNLEDVDEEAKGWVSACERPLNGDRTVLLTNSGFGGTNAALILSLHDLDKK